MKTHVRFDHWCYHSNRCPLAEQHCGCLAMFFSILLLGACPEMIKIDAELLSNRGKGVSFWCRGMSHIGAQPYWQAAA